MTMPERREKDENFLMRRLPMMLAGLAVLASGARAAEDPPTPAAVEDTSLRQLRSVRRVFVDRLTGGETAAQMREILISGLEATHLFVLTENQDRADASLRGGSEDLVFTETHSSSDNINAHANLGLRSGGSGKTGSSQSTGLSLGESESDHSAERRHEAIASVRLVNKDGDVIWATTQESLGARFRGASADAAEKITAKLKEDFEKARKLR
jgi:hypothetical protein